MNAKKSNERNNRITIRVSDEEMKVLKDAAEKDDRTITSFVRMYAIKYAKENFGIMRNLIEEEKLLAKQEDVLKRQISLDIEQKHYEEGRHYM